MTEDIAFYVGLALDCGGPVLEIGVGSGRVAVPVALAGAPVVGVDTSTVMLGRAASRPHRTISTCALVEADMRAICPTWGDSRW